MPSATTALLKKEGSNAQRDYGASQKRGLKCPARLRRFSKRRAQMPSATTALLKKRAQMPSATTALLKKRAQMPSATTALLKKRAQMPSATTALLKKEGSNAQRDYGASQQRGAEMPAIPSLSLMLDRYYRSRSGGCKPPGCPWICFDPSGTWRFQERAEELDVSPHGVPLIPG